MATVISSGTFGDKFEAALQDSELSLRALARILAKGDKEKTETIRRRLNKYRPKPSGGAAEVAPTAPTRHEIELALGLSADSLKPDPLESPEEMIAVLLPSRTLERLVDRRVMAALARVPA